MSYGELGRLSIRIAHFLESRGLKKHDVVAIFNGKTALGFGCMLACLKLGVIYTNLDPSSPPERLRKMLDVCRPKLIWAGAGVASRLRESALWPCEIVDSDDPALPGQWQNLPDEMPASNSRVTGNDPAYIMFTSGSTGFPKGAVMTHANLLNFIAWSRDTFALTPEDRLSSLNPMHFDNSVFDFYSALFTGASLIPVGEDLTKNPRQLLDALNAAGCTVWFSVPSLLVYVLRMRALKQSDLPAIRVISFGGEGFPKTSLRALHGLLGHRAELVNVYGPTECTCICSSYRVGPADLVPDELLPLGPVAPNFDFRVIDADRRPVPPGEIGELCLGGPNVGRGYYRNPEKTREVFIQNPSHNDYRDIYYRTGDLVRYDAGRDLLFFCGRVDNQVKRMGYRIELEEIEAALGSIPYIQENGVIFVKQGDEVGRIVACVCAQQRDEMKLVADLRKLLPPYMIPDRVVYLDGLPKNANGKIDRRALKEMQSA